MRAEAVRLLFAVGLFLVAFGTVRIAHDIQDAWGAFDVFVGGWLLVTWLDRRKH